MAPTKRSSARTEQKPSYAAWLENMRESGGKIKKAEKTREAEVTKRSAKQKKAKVHAQAIVTPEEDQDDEETIFKPEILEEVKTESDMTSVQPVDNQEQTSEEENLTIEDLSTTGGTQHKRKTKIARKPKSTKKSKDKDILKRQIMMDIMQIDLEKKQLEVRKLEAQKRLFALEHE